jgi:hypothetical protein
MYSTKVGTDCRFETHVDPIGVVFYGTAARAKVLGSRHAGSWWRHVGNVEKVTGWGESSGHGDQAYFNQGDCKDYTDVQSISKDFPDPSRNIDHMWIHMRLWQQWYPRISSTTGKLIYHTVGTPHVDAQTDKCGGKDHPPTKMVLPHGGTGDGFKYARQSLYFAYRDRRPTNVVYWGNMAPEWQCDHWYFIRGDGHVNVIRIGKP